MKIFNHIRVLTLFALIIIPFYYLFLYFDELADKNETATEELVKEQLLKEMSEFQEDLLPEKYIENAFKDLETQFNISELNNNTFNDGKKTSFLGKDFIYKASNYLGSKYDMEPFVFITTDNDFSNTMFIDKDKLYDDKDKKDIFLYSCISSIIYQCLNNNKNEFINIKPIVDDTLENFESSYKKLKKYNEQTFVLEVIKNISIFYKNLGKPNKCFAFFANKFGNQRVYEYYNAFLNKGNKSNNILGLYYVLFKGSDINIKRLIYSACFNNNRDKLTKIERKITNKGIKIPTWNLTKETIEFEIPFPSHFYNFILEHRSGDDESYKVYQDYIQNNSLCVFVKRKSIPNKYLTFKNIIKNTLFVIIFLLIIYIFNIFLKIVNFNTPLSLKIRIIVLVAVIVPMTGLWIISYLGMENENRILISKSEKIISDRLELFDKIKNDAVNNFSIDLLKHKKMLEDLLFNSSIDKFFNNFKLIDKSQILHKLAYEGTSNIFSQLYILDKSGKSAKAFSENENKKIEKVDRITLLAKILSEMGLLGKNTEESHKFENHNVSVQNNLSSFLKTYNKNNELAKESHLIPCDTLTPKDKIVYQLLASKDKPDSPEALAFNYTNMKDIMATRVNFVLNNKYKELLSQDNSFAQVKYAVFERDDSGFREIIPQNKSYPYREMQIDSVNKAIGIKNSGSDIYETSQNYYIKTWRYYSDNPLIFVAAAIVPKTQIRIINSSLLFFILLIYSMFATILLSDFFAGAIYEPIKALSSFVNEIRLGQINIKVEMKTGDEMQQLADSFNKMSEGLCEREKLKRFVSDKLFSSIEDSDNKKITKAKVTMLSSDIRGFTTISEKNKPEEVVSLLNDYFTLMEKSIIKFGGSIEKIIGDEISAAFYEDKSKDYVINACKAALEMRKNLESFNKERIAKGLFAIENGIGLATGEVMIGFAGEKSRRREFLLIGEIIKSAKNIESMTKNAVSSRIFIDEQTYVVVKNHMDFCEDDSNHDPFYKELKI